jgi:hypothetical protein
MAGFLCHPIGTRLRCRPQSVQAELDRASSVQATPASGQDQRLTRSDSDKGAAIIPIDAQPLGTKASEEPPGGTTERTSDPPPLAGPAAGCGSRRAPETSFEPVERDTKKSQARVFKNRAAQFCRCRTCTTLLQGHVQAQFDLLRQPLAEPPLNAFEYNPTHLVQRTSTSGPLETLRRGAKANHCSRVLIPEEAAPQFLDDAAPRNGMMPPPDSEMIAPPITE